MAPLPHPVLEPTNPIQVTLPARPGPLCAAATVQVSAKSRPRYHFQLLSSFRVEILAPRRGHPIIAELSVLNSRDA